MKKFLFTMTAMLSVSAAFVSCSDKEVFNQAAVEQAKVVEAEKQYKENFVKRFGEVASDQTWDFSQVNYPMAEQAARTRGLLDNLLPTPTWKTLTIPERVLTETYYNHVNTDFEQVTQLAESADMPVVDWPYNYAQVNLHPFYTHGTDLLNFYFLGVKYIYRHDYRFFDVDLPITDNAFCFRSVGNKWATIVANSSLRTNWNMNSYAQVNTSNMQGVEGFQWFVASREYDWFDFDYNYETLEKCKLFTVNNHTYVALDCNKDGVYTDLICWVEDCSPAKRYMVEDLGSKDDFDFNDIVFDVVWNDAKKKYQCVVRAMGGTLDFTIKVANTTWTKSTDYDITTMYNTSAGYDLTAEYARFDVEGWVPELNDVTVTVKGNDGTFVLPFPKNGEIPYMVCTNIAKEWSKERINVNTIGWFGSVQNDCEIEIKN